MQSSQDKTVRDLCSFVFSTLDLKLDNGYVVKVLSGALIWGYSHSHPSQDSDPNTYRQAKSEPDSEVFLNGKHDLHTTDHVVIRQKETEGKIRQMGREDGCRTGLVEPQQRRIC